MSAIRANRHRRGTQDEAPHVPSPPPTAGPASGPDLGRLRSERPPADRTGPLPQRRRITQTDRVTQGNLARLDDPQPIGLDLARYLRVSRDEPRRLGQAVAKPDTQGVGREREIPVWQIRRPSHGDRVVKTP